MSLHHDRETGNVISFARIGEYRVCFCRMQGPLCDQPVELYRDLGTFNASGPIAEETVVLGGQRFWLNHTGDYMRADDEASIGADCEEGTPSVWSAVAPAGRFRAAALSPGKYSSCWRSGGFDGAVRIFTGRLVVLGPRSVSTMGAVLRPKRGLFFDLDIDGTGLSAEDSLILAPSRADGTCASTTRS